MGIYVNPPTEEKEDFLTRVGKEHDSANAALLDSNAKRLVVVHVDNVIFTAAGVCDTPAEFKAFTDPTDNRAKRYFTVDKVDLIEVCGGDLK